ncbi:MAG: PQQ-binding-like beta-propeller repeat protein [Dehalococcoidia bacterium]|nr:PQQ-binding-like beta-propeller repeat protein [Dehalococcoidia bacterium]
MVTETVVLCPGCGHGNDSGASYCRECRTLLDRGPRVSPEEARDIEARRLSRMRRRRIIRWAVVAVLVVIAAAGATAYTTIGPGKELDPPTTSIGVVSAPGDWPMYQGDPTHSGFIRESQPEPVGEVQWQFRTGAPLFAAPSVVGDTVYLSAGDRRIVALDVQSGEVKWEHSVTGPVNSSPAIADSLVFVGLRDGRLLALDKETGVLHWEYQTGDLVYGSPAVHEGVVYIGSGDSRIYALDALTGELLWSRKTGGRVVASPAISDDFVVVLSQDQRIYIYDTKTGGFRLDYLTREVRGAPSIDDDLAYVGNARSIVYAIDLQQRQLPFEKTARFIRTQLFFWGLWNTLPVIKGFEWAYRSPGEIFQGAPALDDEKVYAVSESGGVYALNKSSGERVWKFRADGETRGDPSLAGDTLYIADTDGTVYGLDRATGEELWRFELNDRVSTAVVVANEMLFVSSDRGVLYAIR